MKPIPQGHWRPDAAQTALLQAALLPGEAAAAAWLCWNPSLRLDTVDLGAYRLLPLVAENLRQQAGGGLPELGRITGIQRRHWYANQLLFQQIHPLLAQLQVMGVPVLLLKGMALALTVYPNSGLRPMEDVDILVPTHQAADVLLWMLRWGWRPSRPLPLQHLEAFLWCASSAELIGPQGGKCDLHWRLFPQPLDWNADQPFWQAARPLVWRGLTLQCLDPTDLLFHVCVHGAAWNATPPLRWIADAHLLLRQKPVLDWTRLAPLAQRHARVPHLRDTLTHLCESWGVVVPDALQTELRHGPLSWQQRAEYTQSCLPLTRSRRLWLLSHRYLRWRRAWYDLPPSIRPRIGSLRWLQLVSGLEQRRELPLHFWRRLRALA